MISAKDRVARVAQYEQSAGPWTTADSPSQILADIQMVDPECKLTIVDVEQYYSELPGYDIHQPDENEDEGNYRLSQWEDDGGW